MTDYDTPDSRQGKWTGASYSPWRMNMCCFLTPSRVLEQLFQHCRLEAHSLSAASCPTCSFLSACLPVVSLITCLRGNTISRPTICPCLFSMGNYFTLKCEYKHKYRHKYKYKCLIMNLLKT